ncbi:hypothetical protein NOCARDAX2BIS_210015 [Nocardioides sp. AX2bis]|nr:hypothetical protein NOCARDAX2BIS_210015 [Nocardioides sp. AX2bis]
MDRWRPETPAVRLCLPARVLPPGRG